MGRSSDDGQAIWQPVVCLCVGPAGCRAEHLGARVPPNGGGGVCGTVDLCPGAHSRRARAFVLFTRPAPHGGGLFPGKTPVNAIETATDCRHCAPNPTAGC